jgi:hypothetical protein
MARPEKQVRWTRDHEKFRSLALSRKRSIRTLVFSKLPVSLGRNHLTERDTPMMNTQPEWIYHPESLDRKGHSYDEYTARMDLPFANRKHDPRIANADPWVVFDAPPT